MAGRRQLQVGRPSASTRLRTQPATRGHYCRHWSLAQFLLLNLNDLPDFIGEQVGQLAPAPFARNIGRLLEGAIAQMGVWVAGPNLAWPPDTHPLTLANLHQALARSQAGSPGASLSSHALFSEIGVPDPPFGAGANWPGSPELGGRRYVQNLHQHERPFVDLGSHRHLNAPVDDVCGSPGRVSARLAPPLCRLGVLPVCRTADGPRDVRVLATFDASGPSYSDTADRRGFVARVRLLRVGGRSACNRRVRADCARLVAVRRGCAWDHSVSARK
jgi:hypothetical protein